MLMGMLNMRLFLKSSIRPLSDLSMHLVGFHCVLGCSVTNAPQESSYGHEGTVSGHLPTVNRQNIQLAEQKSA